MNKKALLIGINKYRVPGADLRGCVNDVHNMQALLVDLYGFAPRDIAVLVDLKATKRKIETGIRRLITGARSGDVLLLHYSGHGANVPDDDGDEADERDEILCPSDLDWKDPLRDDWLRKTFNKLRKGVSLTVIMDCCHSGSNTRELRMPDAPSLPRYLANPWDLMAVESGRKLRGKVTGELRASSRSRRRKTDIVAADIPETLITGCRDTQTSADAWIDGSYNGALTHSLAAAIRATDGRLTYRELHQRAMTSLKRGGFEQIPQLEGRRQNFDRPFLAPPG